MHTYFRAIGFSNIKKGKEMDNLFGDVITNYNFKSEIYLKKNEKFVEVSKVFSKNFGITIRGYYDNKNFFHIEHYFPFVVNDEVSMKEEVYFTKKIDNAAYSCICDDMRLGVALIFYLQNMADFMSNYDSNKCETIAFPIALSGLCDSGKILLPVQKNESEIAKSDKRKKIKNKLLNEAKKGNQEAIDKMVLNEIDTFEKISKRTKVEDIYTIVESSFYPYGSEQDKYTMLGTILNFQIEVNSLSGEEIYILLVECNDVIIKVSVNKNDLLGIPMVGARFKGSIWLQGCVEFDDF